MKEKYGEERHTSRIWTPIDHLNYDYVERMQTRETDIKTNDFMIQNMVCNHAIVIQFCLCFTLENHDLAFFVQFRTFFGNNISTDSDQMISFPMCEIFALQSYCPDLYTI